MNDARGLTLLSRLAKVFVFIAVVYAVERFCHKQTDGFSIHNISSNHPFQKEWEIPQDATEAITILSQPFYYLGKGAQSYVFESEDKKFVLKFFRHSHMKQLDRLKRNFASHRLAFENLRDETGLIFLHLNKSADLKTHVKIYDKIGIFHKLDCDKMEFLIQKKGKLIYSAIEDWMKANEIEKAKKGISSLIDLLILRKNKGIFDKDPDLKTNFGFYEEKAIQIDVGRYKMGSCDKEEILRITDSFKSYLHANYEELAVHLENEIIQKCR